MKRKLEETGVVVVDGIYPVKPTSRLSLNVYCDMTRHGGGWTLIVSSHSNNWNGTNARLRNVDTPSVWKDYSIFQHANVFKSDVMLGPFQYRLEAEVLGMQSVCYLRIRYNYKSRTVNPV